MDLKTILVIFTLCIVTTGSIPAKQIPQGNHCPQCREAEKHGGSAGLSSGSIRKYCGVQDSLQRNSKRSRRYVLRGLQWSKKLITWRLLNFTSKLNPVYTLATISRAFRQWEMNSGLRIKQLFDGKADIMISFEPKKHYIFKDVFCNMEFDGPGGTIGHAFYPLKKAVYAGNIHMDGEEDFSTDGSFGFNFESAILHEIGHSLGLMHSDVHDAVMNPNYAMSAKGSDIKLHIDDITGIQELYGSPKTKEEIKNSVEENAFDKPDKIRTTGAVSVTSSTSMDTTARPKLTTPPEVDNHINDISENRIIDRQHGQEDNSILDNKIEISVKAGADGKKSTMKTPATGITAGENNLLITLPLIIRQRSPTPTGGSNVSGSDRDIALQSSGLNKPTCPKRFDALYVSSITSNTYIFSKFFEYSIGSWLGYEGSSKNIRRKFLFPNVDAAYRRTTDSKLIIFSNQLYAVYRDDVILEKYGAIYDFGFPYAIKKIDAALVFGPYKNTYFFVGDEYWRYNEKYRSMDPGYPKKISSVWRGVPSNLDAAITWKNGLTYFFKGTMYYRIHTRTAAVEYGYPRSIDIWTKCSRFGS